jgi:hypothetical protein
MPDPELQKFLEHLAPYALGAGIFAAICGLICCVLVWFFWSWVGKYYAESWVKFATAVFRFLAAISGFLGKSGSASWGLVIGIAAFGILIWEVTGLIGNIKHERDKKKSELDHAAKIAELSERNNELIQDVTDATNLVLRSDWLLTHLGELTSKKCQRVRDAIASRSSQATVPNTREGLSPELQLQLILENIASHYRKDCPPNQNFRIGLYVEEAGSLAPLQAFDLISKSHAPFTSFSKHPLRYNLTNSTNPSHAVRCVTSGEMMIIEDCQNDSTFEFYSDQQKNYLRSMVAFPLSDFRCNGSGPILAALVIDTNRPNFFLKNDSEILKKELTHFANRLILEYSINELVS